MKVGILNLLDLDFKMKGFWKFVNLDIIFFFFDWGFKKNLEIEYFKYLDYLKCKVIKKILMWLKFNNIYFYFYFKLDMGGE